MTQQFKIDKLKTKAKAFCKKALTYIKSNKLELILIVSVIFADLLTKFIIDKTMSLYSTKVLIKNFLNFHYVLNDQAAFGQSFGLDKVLGIEGVRILFLIITLISLCGFLYFLYYFRKGHIFSRVSIALIIAGAVGNFYDRLFLHAVRDFVEIVFFGLDLPILGRSFAIFNIADTALVVGVIMFSVYFIFMHKAKPDFVGPLYLPEKLAVKADSKTKAQADEVQINGSAKVAKSHTEKETEAKTENETENNSNEAGK